MSDTVDEEDEDDEPPSHADRLVSFLREWGLAEFALDQCNAAIFANCETEPKPQFPVTLDRKLVYLVEAHERFPELRELRDLAKKIRAAFVLEKDLRNTIVHGAPIKFEDNGTVHFIQLRNGRRGPHYAYRVARPSDWDRLDDACARLIALTFVQTISLQWLKPDGSLHESKEAARNGPVKFTRHLPIPRRALKLIEEFAARLPPE